MIPLACQICLCDNIRSYMPEINHFDVLIKRVFTTYLNMGEYRYIAVILNVVIRSVNTITTRTRIAVVIS